MTIRFAVDSEDLFISGFSIVDMNHLHIKIIRSSLLFRVALTVRATKDILRFFALNLFEQRQIVHLSSYRLTETEKALIY